MSLSTTAGHHLHSALKLRRVESTTSASQLEARPQAAPVDQFLENLNTVEQSACMIVDRVRRQCSRRF
jgi:hypothetical protein